MQSEVEQKKKDEEPKYSAEIKQLVANYEKEAGEEMKKENEQNPTDGKTKKPLKKKKKKEQRKPKQRVDSSPRSSENSDDDDDDDPPADGDQDSDSQQSSNDRENKSRSRRPRGSKREEILNWTTCSFSRIGFCEFIYKNIFEGRRSRCNWCGRKGCYVLITWSSQSEFVEKSFNQEKRKRRGSKHPESDDNDLGRGRFGRAASLPAIGLSSFLKDDFQQFNFTPSDQKLIIEGLVRDGIDPSLQ